MMADARREQRERRRSDRSRPSRSRSKSPRNRRMNSPPRRSRSPRAIQNRNRDPIRHVQQQQARPPPQRERDNAHVRENNINNRQDEMKITPVKIDREKVKQTCPLLLRVFCNDGRHNRLEDYSRTAVPKNELQIYTWKDATLKELMNLVKEVNPKARKKGTFFDFATIFPDQRRNGFIMKDIGSTCSGVKSPDDSVSLAEKKFQIGDFLDIAISTPRERRDVF